MFDLLQHGMARFNYDVKFRWRNLNINDIMLINLHISLITIRFFLSIERHSDKTVTLSKFLLTINNFSNKITNIIRKYHEFNFKIVHVILIVSRIPLIFLRMPSYVWRQSIASDTRWRHDLLPSCCWVHLLLFCTPWYYYC